MKYQEETEMSRRSALTLAAGAMWVAIGCSSSRNWAVSPMEARIPVVWSWSADGPFAMVAEFNKGLPYILDVDQGPTYGELQDINFADQIDGSGTLIETAVLFKGAIDIDRRIQLDLTLKDSNGRVIASYSRILEDARQDYQEEQVGALLMTTPTDSHVTVSLLTALVFLIDRIEVELQEYWV